jgi:indolepyruvate ferredoxin oxidoreductase beta subunit
MSEKVQEFNLIVTGVGGQGSVLSSHIIAEGAVEQDYKTRVGETFGASQRGGKVHSHVRIGESIYGPLCPKNSLDVLIGLEPNETLRLAVTYANKDTVVLMNTRPVPSMDVNIGVAEYPAIDKIIEKLKGITPNVHAFDASELAIQAGNDRTMNVVMLGAFAATGKLPYDVEELKEAIKNRVPQKTIETNLKAFDLGYNTVKQ